MGLCYKYVTRVVFLVMVELQTRIEQTTGFLELRPIHSARTDGTPN
jgi:hypothetical protein